ncbi:MAG: permease [Deltaproteobacteria bacterium]|nr:permease [Deltaproteobacteria bacterium]MBW2692202.1 permease [Deltaproteobacteria bacterium]
MKERTKLTLILAAFAACWFLPLGGDPLWGPIHASLSLVKWYAQEHVLLCLVPAFFIAGAISVFVSQGAVMKYLGPQAKKLVAYPVSAVSGTILAVCSCTVLPLFASIHKRGAGLGPATAFLYSGPAINVLAIILTARILGPELGIARAVGAILFAVVIGLLMHLIFRKEESARQAEGPIVMPDDQSERPLWQDGLYFAAMIGILVFANWGEPRNAEAGVWAAIYSAKWIVTGVFGVVLIGSILAWFKRDELSFWVDSSWTFAKQILPLLLGGVLVAGFLLGGPGDSASGIIPNAWIEKAVGGNSLLANFFASFVGAFMYFATLTEVPILEGLIKSGMGKGPALALLLAGPALSLPNMLVIRSVMGTKKTLVFVGLVVVLSTIAGMTYGAFF